MAKAEDEALVVEAAEVATAEHETESGEMLGLTPEAIPSGDGTMPFAAAVRWIACKGRQVAHPADDPVWHAAIRELVDYIASSNCVVSGVIKGVSTKIRNVRFADIDFQWAHDGSGRGLEHRLTHDGYPREYLYVYAAPDQQHWKTWWNDKLYQGSRTRVDRIQIRKVDVRKRWPVSQAEELSAIKQVSTKPPQKLGPLSIEEVEERFAAHIKNMTAQGKKTRRRQDFALMRGLNKDLSDDVMDAIRKRNVKLRKRGPHPTFAWEKLRPFVYQRLAERDRKRQSGWIKAHLVAEASEWCTSPNGFGREPSQSSLDKAVAAFIADYEHDKKSPAAQQVQ